MPGLYEAFSRGAADGNERKVKRTLADYFQPATTGDQNALKQVYGVDPNAGMQAQKMAQEAQGDVRERLQRAASLYGSAPEPMRQAMYTDIKRLAEEAGIAPPGAMPQMLQTPEDQEGFGQFIAKIGSFGNPQESATVQSRFIDNDGNMVALMRDGSTRIVGKADASMQIIEGSGGFYGVDRRTLDANPVNVGGAPQPQSPQPQGHLDPVTDYPSFANQFGAQVTSLRRDPKRNAAVGGVGNSFHLSGEAGDFVVPQEKKAAFIQAVQARGYQAIDEGDHIHVEPPGRGMTRTQFSGRQQLQAPKKQTTQSRRLTPQELAGYGLPDGTVAQVDSNGKVDVIHNPQTRDAGGGKPLHQGVVEKLTNEAGKLENLTGLIGGFADEYAGNSITGGAENMLGRLGGSDIGLATEGQAEWWQQYDRLKNEVRNELFGASLTDGEKKAFEAADVNPRMDPAVIRSNLAKQQTLIRAALTRKAKTWAAQGYNRDAIREATGIDVSAPSGAASNRQAGPRRLKFNPATGKLE